MCVNVYPSRRKVILHKLYRYVHLVWVNLSDYYLVYQMYLAVVIGAKYKLTLVYASEEVVSDIWSRGG